jgi:hypothetical protein
MEFTPQFWAGVSAGVQCLGVIVLVVTAIAGFVKYRETKHKDRLAKNFEIRRTFALEPQLYEIQGKIEYESTDLAEILEKLVNAEKPRNPGLLTDQQEQLRQQLDNYINILEAVGSLRYCGWLQQEDFAGFWNYYFLRIREWELLWKYVSNKKYEWDDVVRWAKDATNQLRGR